MVLGQAVKVLFMRGMKVEVQLITHSYSIPFWIILLKWHKTLVKEEQ